MPADSGKLAENAQDLVQWILDQALDGIGPLPSASDLADDYKSKPYANDAERVQGLIRWAVAKNAGSGFVTGLGGGIVKCCGSTFDVIRRPPSDPPSG